MVTGAVEQDLVYVHDEAESLPDGWKVTTLEGLISDNGLFCDGDWVESKDQDPNGDVRLIQLADIGVAAYRDRSDRYLTSERASALSCTFLQRGDILVARMPDPLGRACLFPGDKKRAVTVVDVAVIRPNNPEVDCRWLMHRINSMAFRNAVASLQSGSTRLRISRRNLSRIAFPLPPLAVQLAIVDELEKQFSRLDEAVANLQRVKANLKRYKASVLKAAVEGRLVETEASIARREGRTYETGEQLLQRILEERSKESKGNAKPSAATSLAEMSSLPEGWVWTTLGQCFRVAVGATPSRKESTYWQAWQTAAHRSIQPVR
jgi:type I restriction enzyme, S subunit